MCEWVRGGEGGLMNVCCHDYDMQRLGFLSTMLCKFVQTLPCLHIEHLLQTALVSHRDQLIEIGLLYWLESVKWIYQPSWKKLWFVGHNSLFLWDFRLVFFTTKELCMYGRFVHCDVQKKATYEDHDEEWRKVGAPWDTCRHWQIDLGHTCGEVWGGLYSAK